MRPVTFSLKGKGRFSLPSSSNFLTYTNQSVAMAHGMEALGLLRHSATQQTGSGVTSSSPCSDYHLRHESRSHSKSSKSWGTPFSNSVYMGSARVVHLAFSHQSEPTLSSAPFPEPSQQVGQRLR